MRLFISLIILLGINSCGFKQEVRSVIIQPLGEFESSLIDTIRETIIKSYHFEVDVLPFKPLPESAYVSIKSSRYRADSLLNYLISVKPDTVDYIVGITGTDISTTKLDSNGNTKIPESKYSDWGVIGLAYCPGVSSVVSSFRLKHPDAQTEIERLKKVIVHEVGHNLGLEHCTSNSNCVMRDAAETVITIDRVGFELCEACFHKINF